MFCMKMLKKICILMLILFLFFPLLPSDAKVEDKGVITIMNGDTTAPEIIFYLTTILVYDAIFIYVIEDDFPSNLTEASVYVNDNDSVVGAGIFSSTYSPIPSFNPITFEETAPPDTNVY